MSKIEIDIEEFKKVAKLFNSAADSYKKGETKIKNATDDLLSTWKGDAKNAFEKEYSDLKKEMYNYSEILRTIGGDLQKIADTYKEFDEDLKNALRNS